MVLKNGRPGHRSQVLPYGVEREGSKLIRQLHCYVVLLDESRSVDIESFGSLYVTRGSASGIHQLVNDAQPSLTGPRRPAVSVLHKGRGTCRTR